VLRRGVKQADPQSQTGAQSGLFALGPAAWSTTSARLGVLAGWVLSITGRRRHPARDVRRMTKAELYDEARRLGVSGRSKMDRGQLAEAIRRAPERSSSSNLVDRRLAGAALVSRSVWAFRALSPAVARRVVSPLRGLPTRSLILSFVMLAAGVLGLTLAYAVAPGEDLGGQVLRASRTLRTETVTGPGGTTTFVVTKTKHGKITRVPVRVLRTITGPGGTQTMAVAVAGPAITQVRKTTETQVVTQIQPVTEVVTNVVTQPETVVVTTTVVIEVTTTLPPLPPPP